MRLLLPMLSQLTVLKQNIQMERPLLSERFTERHKRFMQVFTDYLDGVIKESGLRSEKRILTVAEHRPLRRKFSGTQAAFSLFQYIHGINLPNSVFQDKAFTTMYWAAVDMVNTSNVSSQ